MSVLDTHALTGGKLHQLWLWMSTNSPLLFAAACSGILFIGSLTDYAGYSGAIGIIGLIVLAGALGFFVPLEYDRKSVAGRVP